MSVDSRIPGITLRPEEEVLSIVRPHWLIFVGIGQFLMYILTLGIAFLVTFLKWKNFLTVVTTHRVIHQEGVISKNQRSINLDKIQDCTFAISGLFNRIMGIGSIKIETAGSSASSNIVIPYIAKPQELSDLIQNEMHEFKKREMREMAKAMRA